MARNWFPDGSFPFVVPHQTVESIRPEYSLFGLSFDDTFRFYHRVRRWQLTLTVSGTFLRNRPMDTTRGAVADPPGGYTLTARGMLGRNTPAQSLWRYSVAADFGGFGYVPINDENGLLGDAYSTTLTTPDLGGSLTVSPAADTHGNTFATGRNATFLNFDMFLRPGDNDDADRYEGLTIPPMVYDVAAALYYPRVFISCDFGFTSGSTGHDASPGTDGPAIQFVTQNIHPGASTGTAAATMSVTFAGQTQNLAAYWTTVNLSDRITDYTIDCTVALDISPLEYWAYTKPDGTIPLWQTATGDPAVNPATGVAFTQGEIMAAPLS